jgi:quinol monooxygenase YgiN/ribosomal protein S18 acetylase RimI-like enzyme
MYGLIGKIIATPGQRDALIAILQRGSAKMPGCHSYVIARDTADADAIWITEVWDSPASHQASLALPAVQAAIAEGRPLIAGFGERFVTEPIVGQTERQSAMPIRLATPADLPLLYAVDHIAHTEAKRRAFIAQAVVDERVWMVELDGQAGGYSVIRHDFFGHSFLEMLYIATDWRGQGLGPKLIRFIETQSRSAMFFTSTNESNRHMQHVLEKLGYKRSGIIHNLDPEDPELVYVVNLVD